MKRWRAKPLLILVVLSLAFTAACLGQVSDEVAVAFAKLTLEAEQAQAGGQAAPQGAAPAEGQEQAQPPPAEPVSTAPMVSVSVDTNCREGPGADDYPEIVGALMVGEEAEVVGRSTWGNYYIVKNLDAPPALCWLWGEYATLTGDETALVDMTPPPKPTSPAPFANFEADTNRVGNDFSDFDVGSPEECRAECLQDNDCLAFTYVQPGIQGPSARCWLKNPVPAASADPCCISGVVENR